MPRQTIPLEQVNAMLVDTGRNALLFCDKFIARFHAKGNPLTGRVRALHRTFHELLVSTTSGATPTPSKPSPAKSPRWMAVRPPD